MRLTAHTDYGIRILMTLAMSQNKSATVKELAARHRISANHLNKVAQSLVAAGLLSSVRGRGGGLRFTHAPQDITIARIVRALERENGFVDCLGDRPQDCVFSGVCILTKSFKRALNAFYAELERYSLADAIENRKALWAALAGEGG